MDLPLHRIHPRLVGRQQQDARHRRHRHRFDDQHLGLPQLRRESALGFMARPHPVICLQWFCYFEELFKKYSLYSQGLDPFAVESLQSSSASMAPSASLLSIPRPCVA